MTDASINGTETQKNLLYVISESVPFKPNYTEIGRAISSDRSTVADYMVYLEKSGLLRLLNISSGGMSLVEKVEKISWEYQLHICTF